MRATLITALLLLLTLLPAGAVKKFDFNPINVAVVLVEKADSTNIESFFKYYGYALQGTEDGYNVMKDTNGNEIRYTFKSDNISQKHPIVKVKTTEQQKNTDDRLSELKFQKIGNVYKRTVSIYNNFITRGKLESSSYLIFERIQKQ